MLAFHIKIWIFSSFWNLNGRGDKTPAFHFSHNELELDGSCPL